MIAAVKRRLVASFWGKRLREQSERIWMHEPAVRRTINAAISGDPDLWPMDWFQRWCGGRVFERAVSLGCGSGPLERDLMAKGLCRSILGLDLSEDALSQARDACREAGLSGIEYRWADLDRPELPEAAFDAVFFHQALHHVENLEGCLAAARRALAPGGLIYVDEYVGPSRDGWSAEVMAPLEAVWRRLPDTVKRSRRLRPPVHWRDPSEGIRSAEILGVLEQHFTPIERRGYGGNLLSVIHQHLRHELIGQPVWEDTLELLIAEERRLLAAGAAPYFTVWIGEPL